MLPPQLRTNASRPLASKVSSPRSSLSFTRSFWWRRCLDWTSHTDLGYHRFNRIRTLKTRAKLLEKLRRRGKFNWDLDQRPFFTPKHIRWASHWGDSGSGGRRRWPSDDVSKDESQNDGEVGQDGYELSQREKAWQEQVERLRQRVASDPYEAIFGKRFEPFWSPLVPSWMREEMGLQGWPRPKENPKSADPTPTAKEQTMASAANTKPTDASRSAVKDVKPVSRSPAPSPKRLTETPVKPRGNVPKSEPKKPQQEVPTAAVETKTSQPTSYSYASSTSWDSFTNKTRRAEWDSISNRTKQFEYDPISNRMVLVDPVNAINSEEAGPSSEKIAAPLPRASPMPVSSADTPATDIQVKQSTDLRQSIPIPPSQLQPYQSMSLELETRNALDRTKIVPTSTSPSRPAALAKMPASDLDLLTADHVRASMGKTRHAKESAQQSDPLQRGQLENEYDRKANARDTEIDAILRSKDSVKPKTPIRTEWDQAEMSYILERELEALRKKKEKLLKDEHGLFHIEKQKREVLKLDNRIGELVAQVASLASLRFGNQPSERMLGQDTSAKLGPATGSTERSSSAPAIDSERKTLQPALDRVQTRAGPRIIDPDDSAAHESTEPLQVSALPKEWSKQAEMVQADRVQRTSSKRPYPMKRWIDDMTARKVEYDAAKEKERMANAERDAGRNSRLEKASAMLQAEVKNQKLRMQAYETRYAHNLQNPSSEVETSYKQSTVYAENHLERIKSLEQELSNAQKSAAVSKVTAVKQIQAYKQKVQSLRGELEIAYKQSAVHSQKHLEHIRELEQNLARAQSENAASQAAVDHSSSLYKGKLSTLRGELEIAYKQSTVHAEKHVERIRQLEQELGQAIAVGQAHERDAGVGRVTAATQSEQRSPANITQLSREATTSLDHQLTDQELVAAVREIYERRYGKINFDHRQPPDASTEGKTSSTTKGSKHGKQVVEIESDVDLGEALAKYEEEKELQNRPQKKSLENEIALREREAHEAQALLQPENSTKMRSVISDSLKPVGPQSSSKPEIAWEEPPVYKVLAYDSGNDLLSTATTTANFTGSENAISIQQALSQLYQPARFVSHFAELQKEGYQAIHGTKDLLVFRKVRSTSPAAQSATKSLKPASKAAPQTTIIKESSTVSRGNRRARRELAPSNGVNPVDGMRATPATGNFASPTGFVNHDPVIPLEQPSQNSAAAAQYGETSYKIDPLRIRRQEPHFTATSTTSGTAAGAGVDADAISGQSSSSSRYWSIAHRRHARMEERRRHRRNRRRSSLGWVVKTGLGVAAVMYLVGAAEEKSRERGKRDYEWTGKTTT